MLNDILVSSHTKERIIMPYFAVQDGTKLYYEEYGHGETVLFVHGLSSSHFELRNFISGFRGNYHCVCYDHRGHAASDHPANRLRKTQEHYCSCTSCLRLRYTL